MGCDQGSTVTGAIHKLDGHEVGDELGGEVEQDQAPQHLVGDVKTRLKDDEEERRQVVDDGLGDVSGVASAAGVVESHARSL